MWFMNYIISRLENIGEHFFDAYVEVSTWWDIFRPLASVLYRIYLAFYWLANHFYQFNEWLVWAAGEIGKIISSFDIMDLIAPLTQWGIKAWEWVEDALHNVLVVINDWWLGTYPVIQGWIDVATQGFTEVKTAWDNFWTVTFPAWTTELANLKGCWDDFWKVTYPDLVSFKWLDTWWNSRIKDVDKLINDTIKAWFPFHDSLAKLWDSVEEFFTDPEDWLYKAFYRIVERFW